jgi:hydroxymethylbilane synthase
VSGTSDTLVVGTRGSQLARAQTQWVINHLRQLHPPLDIRMEIIRTTGDRLQSRPLPEIGVKGLFTAELEQALLDGRIDLAVHSAKDLPTDLTPGLAVLAWPPREDPRDAWVSADGIPLLDLPKGSVVGTSSLRRQAQLLVRRPDLKFVGLRGNIDTRIRKIRDGQCAGAVLAMAGLIRANLTDHVTHVLEPLWCLPAPGQGALALQGRADDERVRGWLQPIHDPRTATLVETERAILAALDAGCRAPVAIYAVCVGTILRCDAVVLDPQGKRSVRATAEDNQRRSVISRMLEQLRAGGANEIIAACRAGEGT